MQMIWKKFAALFAPLLALFAMPACASQTPVASAGPVRAAPIAPAIRPALWKVEDEDSTIYLFGTVHVLPDGIEWFDGAVAEAFAQSGSLVTEIADSDQADMAQMLTQMAMLPEGETLRGSLTGEQRAAYETALGQYKLPAEAFDRFEPWYVAVTLSTLPLMQGGFSPQNGVDHLLDKRAEERGIVHAGLETTEYQFGLFDTLPEPVQQRYLGQVIEQLPTIRRDIGAMVAAWKIGEAEKLAELMNDDTNDPVLVETLLTGRNRQWAQWIDKRLEEPGTTFLAVGAGHLAGPGSVQEQLAALGIETTRVQ